MTEVDLFLAERRRRSDERLAAVKNALLREIPEAERVELLGHHTCIYAVGSGGRGELSRYSDLDLFLVKQGSPRRVDEIRLQSAVIRALRSEGFEDPSNDASFLKLHAAEHLIERLGEPSDDTENTFTVRMLLLLESRPLLGDLAHERLAKKALDAYWKNVEAHREDYLPIVFFNDIIRYWRMMLLNYESKTADKQRRVERMFAAGPSPERTRAELDLEADKNLRSYKLRFSRCLLCYSSVAYLMAEAYRTQTEQKRAHVTREVVDHMVMLPPMDRLREAIDKAKTAPGVTEIGRELTALYAQFLRDTDRSKNELHAIFVSRRDRKPLFNAAKEFGEKMYDFIMALGHNNPMFRYLVV
ncbi:MAG: hypothetical protein IPK82_21515 [Polyangiaceae bacterium]|nr:hypothetical protein [Polyangiaceae bacterium]